MLAVDSALLSFLAHPCIGAFIGYLTNKIAIRMLFRPLRPWYVFGLRVPMTPGVIPAKREALAVNIGEMVGHHLLTSRDIGGAISAESFQEHLTRLVEGRVEAFCQRELGAVADILPLGLRTSLYAGVTALQDRLGAAVAEYCAGRDFADGLALAMDQQLAILAGRELNTLLDADGRQSLYLALDGLVQGILHHAQTERWLTTQMVGSLQRAATAQCTIGDLLPDPLRELGKELLEAQTGALLQRLGTQLVDPPLRAQVVAGIISGINQFLDSLGPIGAMAKGFFETDTLEPKIGAYLDDRQGAFLAWLAQPEMQARMAVAVAEGIDAFLAKPLEQVLADLGASRVEELCRAVAVRLLTVCGSEEMRTGLRATLHMALEEALDQGRRPVGDVAAVLLGDDAGRQAREAMVHELVGLFSSGASQRLVATMIGNLIDSLLERPLGRLEERVPQEIRRGLAGGIVAAVNRMLMQDLPEVVEALQLKRIVTEKVDSLNLLQLERLLLSIMEEQFKYINLFGAILGFLIGLINLAVIKLV